MYNISDELKATLASSHRLYTRAEIYASGSTSPDVTLDLLDGNVTIDDVAIRRRATCTLTDPTGELIPSTANDLLAPLGTEVKLFRGAWLNSDPTQHEELCIITGGLADIKIDDSGQGLHISLDIYDRAQKVSRAKLAQEYLIVTGTNYGTAIANLVKFAFPSVTLDFDAVSLTSPLLVFQTGWDPWEQAQKMAISCGCDLFFDPDGTCVLRTIPNPEDSPVVASYIEGEGSQLLYLNKRLQNEHTFNHVVVTGESSSNASPARGEAIDNDPTSPTYYLGQYGDVVYTELGSSLVTSVAQATTYAQALLYKYKGAGEVLQIQSLVNPAHELGDIVKVTRGLSKIDTTYILDKITLPMVHDRPADLSTRERRLG